ncbi:MAG: hypothetical protein JSS63_00110 [Bacteroidetes bacterium]|nr:hypothetical protein [Bacteroidota bacterium]
MEKIVLNNVPDSLYNSLKLNAERKHKTLEEEALSILADNQAARTQREVNTIIQELKTLHEKINLLPMDDLFLHEAKNLGRD